ncbi:serine protease [Gigaspora margarita]|uniref:Serine protease n=1 Tax=Gigaspora margarita TaxID=4874 RepID=A0A8H3ZZP7_GIGMA|nr:serine protease [Gigaspora margarita]
MNKKIFTFLLIAFLIAMIVPSIASVIYQRNNISDTLTFLTSERINETSRFKNKYKRNERNKTRSENKLYFRTPVVPPNFSIVSPYHNYPIGRFLIRTGNNASSCTASIINTSNGNIGLTAAHCLFDPNTGVPFNLSFFYHFLLGHLPSLGAAVPHAYIVTRQSDDYALVRFAFSDPSGLDMTLQDYTEALGWRFDIGDNETTSIFGYPGNGDMENCAKDSNHLCEWQIQIYI